MKKQIRSFYRKIVDNRFSEKLGDQMNKKLLEDWKNKRDEGHHRDSGRIVESSRAAGGEGEDVREIGAGGEG